MSEHVSCDVAVVGGGPGGMVAARDLARQGLDVVLIDEQPLLGGQYFKQRAGRVLDVAGPHRGEGAALARAVVDAGARVWSATAVWGVTDDRAGLLVAPAQGPQRVLQPRAMVVATGAIERTVPFPGWELPGVMTAGGASHLAHVDLTAIGDEVVVAGSGPFLLPVACALLEVGARVHALVELGHPFRPRRGSLAAVRHPARLAEAARYLVRLRRAGVELLTGSHVQAAEGTDRVRAVVVATPAGVRRFVVDALAIGHGFRPNVDLLRLLGATVTFDTSELGPVPACDELGETDVQGVFAVGEVRGIAGAEAAMVRGGLAAHGVCRRLGVSPQSSDLRELRSRHESLEAFAELLRVQYPDPSRQFDTLDDDVTVCRCEQVSVGAVRAAARLGWNDVNGIKSHCRAGMGTCQGRQCEWGVAAISRSVAGAAPTQPMSSRMPVVPQPVRSFLDGDDQ